MLLLLPTTASLPSRSAGDDDDDDDRDDDAATKTFVAAPLKLTMETLRRRDGGLPVTLLWSRTNPDAEHSSTLTSCAVKNRPSKEMTAASAAIESARRRRRPTTP